MFLRSNAKKERKGMNKDSFWESFSKENAFSIYLFMHYLCLSIFKSFPYVCTMKINVIHTYISYMYIIHWTGLHMYNFWSTSNKLNVETFLNLKKWIWRRRFWQLWYDILNFACVQNWKQNFSTILCWRVTSFCTTCADIFAGLAKYRKQINADHAIYQYYSRINSLFSRSRSN